MDCNDVKEISSATQWQTKDGKEFYCKDEACKHAKTLKYVMALKAEVKTGNIKLPAWMNSLSVTSTRTLFEFIGKNERAIRRVLNRLAD